MIITKPPARVSFELDDLRFIHYALHLDDYDNITMNGWKYHVSKVNTSGAKFNRVNIGDILFITQNLRKKSSNTDWVKTDPDNRMLTWVIHDQYGYRGKMISYNDDGVAHDEYHIFDPKGGPDMVLKDEEFRTPVAQSQEA